MPIYDYQCQSCQYKAEVMRKVTAPSVEQCPQCHEEAFSKQLSAPSFQLNGSGWYATDFKNSGSKPANVASTNASQNTDVSTNSANSCEPGCGCH